MALTEQQQSVLITLQDENTSIVLTPACAGSGKTHTLIELASCLGVSSGIYLAYNKSIADEAALKFKGTPIQCLTTHSLAYRAVVRQYGLKVGFFNPRDVVTKGVTYKDKKLIVDTLEGFLSSPEVDPNVYLQYEDNDLTEAVLEHLHLMTNGKLSCSHNFYLKLYHVLLASGELEAPATEILMLDEFGDINPVTLEIFKLINSPKKIAVGDSKQNIYSFNGTIDGFKALAHMGVTVPLTHSFRVADHIATAIEFFMVKNVDPSFEFKGRRYPIDTPITTRGYIARRNAGLVEKMFDLMADNVCFHTVRPIETIIELPLILSNIGNGKPIKDYQFKHIEQVRTMWAERPSIRNKYNDILDYVAYRFEDDEDILRAVKVVKRHSSKSLNDLAAYCKHCKSCDTSLTLTTAHSSKGLEFSSVELCDDMSQAVRKAQEGISELNKWDRNYDIRLKGFQEEFLLYYVACSRAMVELKNATALGKIFR